jgi:hypothetical protein
MMMFFQGERAGDHIVLDTNSFARHEEGMDITRKLILVDAQGNNAGTLHTKTTKRNFANMSFDEKEMMAMRWSCAHDGRVFVSDDFDGYSIVVYNPDGTVDRVIERDYEHRKRSKEEMERNAPRVMFRRRGGATQRPETKASETDRDILAMHPRDDGTLWVVSSHGGLDAPEGTIATFDVFDRDGKFRRQVSIAGDGDFEEDGVHFVGDRVYVVKGFRSAERAQRGGEGEATEEEIENAEPISLVCYELGQKVQGSR